jgi:tRNA threonylcarbamoyladenosine modification (KEOPS) complex  Pcc1 subunit
MFVELELDHTQNGKECKRSIVKSYLRALLQVSSNVTKLQVYDTVSMSTREMPRSPLHVIMHVSVANVTVEPDGYVEAQDVSSFNVTPW